MKNLAKVKGRVREQEKGAARRFSEAIQKRNLQFFIEEKDDPRFLTLFGMLADPAYERYSFYRLLKKAQISLGEIHQVYFEGQRHLGLMAVAEALPQIMADVARDAQNSLQPCPRCDSTGMVIHENKKRTCPLCQGAKEISRMGDRHARDLVFETAKLTHQSQNIVAVQTNVHIGDDRLESMLKRTRSIILPDKPKVPHERSDPRAVVPTSG
jgi:rubrerythrin